MDDLNKRIENLEKMKLEKQISEQNDIKKSSQHEEVKQQQVKNFLGNIQSFDIDDM